MTAPLGNQLVLFPLNLSVSLESQCFPRPELGTLIFVYLINRDKTHVVEWVLASHCTKSLMQCFLVLQL